jgi:hypothetical protein
MTLDQRASSRRPGLRAATADRDSAGMCVQQLGRRGPPKGGHDVTERQAHGSQPVRVRSGETPGSPVAALPASGEIPGSKRRKTAPGRGRATGQSAASSEACSVVRNPRASGPRGSRARIPEAKATDGTREPGAGAQEPSGVGGVEWSEGCRGNWRGPRWPRACGAREAGPPITGNHREVAGGHQGVGGGRSTA